MCVFGSERLRAKSKRLSAVSAKESAPSDQASQVAVRWLIPPTTRPCCSLALSVTTPLYSTTISQTLRGRGENELLRTPSTRSSQNSSYEKSSTYHHLSAVGEARLHRS